MKIRLLLSCAALFGCLVSATACGKDDGSKVEPPVPPTPSEIPGSGDMRVRLAGENLYITAKLDAGHDIIYWFKSCLFNQLYTFYRVGLIDNAEETVSDPLKEPTTVLNLAYSDNIGPFAVSGNGWCGANHSYKEGGTVRTAATERYSIAVNGVQPTSGVLMKADSVTVDVVNVIYDPSRPLEGGALVDPLCRETVHYRIQGGNIEVRVSHAFCPVVPVTVDRYYGMQSMFEGETHTFTSAGAYTDWTPQAGVSRFKKGDYPDFRRYVEKNAKAYQSAYLLNEGLGDHAMVSDGGDVFIGNSSNKTYHWLIASKRFSNGDKTSWRGVYTWFTEALADDDDLLCYEGMVGGRRALFIDAKQACSRTIELPEGYDATQFEVSDRRSLDEVVRWLIGMGYTPSFCTACYREGRTGDRFMSLCKSGQIQNCCLPNALMTLKEYLIDYASPETKKAGDEMILREVETIPNENARRIVKERLELIEKGERDFRF